jgi:hypothetical protein
MVGSLLNTSSLGADCRVTHVSRPNDGSPF